MNKTFLPLFFIVLIPFVVFSQPYNWQLKQSGSSLGGPIDVELNNSDIVYYGSNNKIYRSTDRGETFSQMGVNVPSASEIKNIILNDDIPGTMLVAIEGTGSDQILKTTDYGATWEVKLSGLSFSFFGIPMTPDPSHPDTIYTMSGSSFYRSTDFGETWNIISSNFGLSSPCDIEVFPDTSIILIGDNGTGIFRSTDYGMTWTQKYNTTGEIPTIAVDPQGSGTAFATKWGGGGGFLKSTDFGNSWISIPYFNGNNMWGVHVSPTLPNYVMTACYSCGNTYLSKDNGVSWMPINISPSNYQIHIVDTTTVFAAQSGGFYKLFSPSFIPVELTSFSASVNEGKILLNWSTATELNNSGFEIQRSLDNYTFEKIDFVPGFGTSTEQHNYSYVVEDISAGKQYFRLKQIDFDGTFEYSKTIEVEFELPQRYSLQQNFPNPFNPSTTISFTLPTDAKVKLSIMNLLGEELTQLVNSTLTAGIHQYNFNAEGLSSGIYFYRLEAEGADGSVFSKMHKMILMK
ncbi:MAG: hypothetical protein Kow0098_28310 [Ignavibacteriaceae bacterium]